MTQDLTELIRGLSPGALSIFKRQIATLPESEREMAYTRLSDVPELSDIIGRPTPVRTLTKEEEMPLWQRPLKWIEDISVGAGTLLAAPFTPAVPGAEGLSWWERERAEYEAWEEPGFQVEPMFRLPWTPEEIRERPWTIGVKGALEMTPWIATSLATGGLTGLAGLGARTGMPSLIRAAGMGQKILAPIKAAEALPITLAGKAIKPIIRPLLKPARGETGRFTAIASAEIEKQITHMDWQRRVAQMFGRRPVLKTLTERIGGRAATVTEVAEDATARALLVAVRVQENLLSKGQVALASLPHPDPIRLFGVDEFTGIAKNVKVRVKGSSRHMADIAEHPTKYTLTSEQSAYIKTVHDIEDWVLAGLKEEGIDVKLLKFDEFSHWVHREVIGKNIDDALVKIRSRGGGRIGAKATWEKTRFYETAADGVKAGILYEPSLKRVVELYIQSAAKRISDQRIAKMIAELGEKPLERAMKFAPEVLEEAIKTAAVLKGARQLTKVINRAIRGEKIPEATLKAQERFSGLGTRLREATREVAPETDIAKIAKGAEESARAAAETAKSARIAYVAAKNIAEQTRNPEALLKADKLMKIAERAEASATKFEAESIAWAAKIKPLTTTERQEALKTLLKDAKTLEETARAPYWKAKAKRAVVMERAKTPTLGTEATIAHPAFQGKIYPKDVAGEIQRYWDDMGWGPLNKLATLSGNMRTLVAAADFSAMFIQGLPGIALHPQAWARGAIGSFKAFKNPRLYEEMLRKNVDDFLEMAHYGGYVGGFEFMEAMPHLQKFFGTATRVVAGRRRLGEQAIRQSYGRFEASFGFFGDSFRKDMWNALKGRAKNPQEMMEISRHINRMSGVMSSKGLGLGKTQRDFEQAFMFFAPRYTRAGFALVGDMFKGGLTGGEARKALGSMMAAGATFYAGVCMAMGQEPNFNPENGQFMTVEITDPMTGTTRHFGIGGMMTSLLRFGADITASVIGQGMNEPLDFVKLNRFDNPFMRFLFSKSAPLTGFMEGMVFGHNYFGEPFENVGDYSLFLLEQVMPIAMQAAFMEEAGLAPTAIMAEELGMRTFPRSDWEKRDIIRDRLAQEKFGMNWEDMGRTHGLLEQEKLERDSTELQEATELAAETTTKIARGEGKIWSAWKIEGRSIQDHYKNMITLASKEYESTRDGITFRQRVDEATTNRRAMYGRREQDPAYTEVYDYFNEPLEKEVLEKMGPNDLPRREYYQMMYSPDMYDEFGRYRFDEADKREIQFVQKYGQATLDYVEEYMGAKWEEPTPMKILREARKALEPYWEISDRIWSMYSPELKRISDEIQILERTDPDQAKRILRQYPQILRARELIARYRKQMRDRNPLIKQYYNLFYAR